MQNLDVISINLWQILISLCNLFLLFLILKKFLYKPVKKMMAQRQAALDEQYEKAAESERAAEIDRKAWAEKMQGAKAEADRLVKTAEARADRRSEQIVAKAKDEADGILRDAQSQAVLEKKKAEAEIKREIVDVSAALTEKILRREISEEDHRAILDSVLSEIGEENDGYQ